MGGRRRKKRVEPTDDWSQLELLCGWPEQVAYEEIRPLVLFGSSVPERSERTGSSERTLYRKASRFEAEGMDRCSPPGAPSAAPCPRPSGASSWT